MAKHFLLFLFRSLSTNTGLENLLVDSDKGLTRIALDNENDKLQKDGWAVIDRPLLKITDPEAGMVRVLDLGDERPELPGFLKRFAVQTCLETGARKQTFHKIKDVQPTNLQAGLLVGTTAKVDVLTLDKPWLENEDKISELLGCVALLRKTIVYTQSEELALAEEPIEENVCGGFEQSLELDGYYEGLEAGRWVIVSGEREIGGTSGVRFSELAMLASVNQDTRNAGKTELEGDKLHTFVKLAKQLQYCFKRETVTIQGNVVKATHGETHPEVLGSGDGAKALQIFNLRQPPLTYVPAANPSGVDSTLKVYVNNVEWHETDALSGLAPTGRNFVTKIGDDGKTTIVFGNGRQGARLPSGTENIRAVYRKGIGKAGNVNAGQD